MFLRTDLCCVNVMKKALRLPESAVFSPSSFPGAIHSDRQNQHKYRIHGTQYMCSAASSALIAVYKSKTAGKAAPCLLFLCVGDLKKSAAQIFHSKQKMNRTSLKIRFIFARREGLEPPTYWFVASHSIRLSYRRITNFSIQFY